MKQNIDSFFEKPFVKEYLFNLQINQKISLVEFLFTRKVLMLFLSSIFLIWYNQDSPSIQRYIAIISALLLLYMFKNNRILKKEKYFITEDKAKKDNTELLFHSFYNKKVKKILKQNYILIGACLFAFNQNANAEFATNIDSSTTTQQENNELYKKENEEMVRQSKMKNIMYLSQEKKSFLTRELNNQIKIESDLQTNIIRTNLEKSKNEIKK